MHENVCAGAKAASLGEAMIAGHGFYRRELKNSPTATGILCWAAVYGVIAAVWFQGYAPPDDWQGLKGYGRLHTAGALGECGLVIDNDEGCR
jgi:hypothetical protein